MINEEDSLYIELEHIRDRIIADLKETYMIHQEMLAIIKELRKDLSYLTEDKPK